MDDDRIGNSQASLHGSGGISLLLCEVLEVVILLQSRLVPLLVRSRLVLLLLLLAAECVRVILACKDRVRSTGDCRREPRVGESGRSGVLGRELADMVGRAADKLRDLGIGGGAGMSGNAGGGDRTGWGMLHLRADTV